MVFIKIAHYLFHSTKCIFLFLMLPQFSFMKRRKLIQLTTAAIAGLYLPKISTAGSVSLLSQKRKRSLRIAHITDVHIQPELNAPIYFEKCLHHLQSLPDKPDIIFNGGDTIMDALEQEKSRVVEQWDLWHSIVKNECSLKIEHCIGNHDVWGLKAAMGDPLYGKRYALDMMQIEKRYRSFDLNGWHFIVLDSTHLKADGSWYTAKLDEEQFDWLKNDLAATNPSMPVLILSHIPILAGCVFYDGDNRKGGDWNIPGSWMHIDSIEIVSLFSKHANVKACLSGHIHLLDKVEYNGVSYYCNGAVSGNWWDGDYHETKAGYAIVDLFDDGTTARNYFPYQQG